jgi:hypothetical protein
MMIRFGAIIDDVPNKTVTFHQVFHAGKFIGRVGMIITAGQIDAGHFQSPVF